MRENKVERLAYSIAEMAAALGVSQRTVWTHIKTGSIPVFRMGTRVLIATETLRQFIA